MRNIFYTTLVFCVFQLFTISSHASDEFSGSFDEITRIEYLYGTGYGSGFCRGDNFADFCLRQIKDRSESDAKWDVEYQCRAKQGQLSFYGTCNTFCSPLFLIPGRDEFVTCNARCSYSCEIRQ